MKKLTTLLLAAGLVFAASAPASAVDVKMDGEYIFQFTRGDHQKFGDHDGDFDNVRQRVRIGMTASVSENLSGYFQIDSKWFWGNNQDKVGANGSAFDGAKTQVRMYRAYIDWMIPQTDIKVRMGRHDIKLPAFANGKNSVLWSKDPVDGVTIAAPVTDWLGLTAFWGRFDRVAGTISDTDTDQGEKLDAFGIVADTKFDGFTFSPFLMYASYGDGTGNGSGYSNRYESPNLRAQAYWAGFAGSLTMFDPFVAKVGFAYGDRNYTDGNNTPSQHGWFADLSLSYKTAYGTPELYGFYGSGDPEHAQYATQGNMPTIGGRFAGSYGYFNGMTTMDNELQNNHSGHGAWGVRLGMKNISFLQDLSHDIAVLYAQGTNDSTNTGLSKYGPWRYLTTDDSIVEFDFGTTYMIYKNLAARFEAAYIIENFETGADKGRANKYDNAWALNLQFKYTF